MSSLSELKELLNEENTDVLLKKLEFRWAFPFEFRDVTILQKIRVAMTRKGLWALRSPSEAVNLVASLRAFGRERRFKETLRKVGLTTSAKALLDLEIYFRKSFGRDYKVGFTRDGIPLRQLSVTDPLKFYSDKIIMVNLPLENWRRFKEIVPVLFEKLLKAGFRIGRLNPAGVTVYPENKVLAVELSAQLNLLIQTGVGYKILLRRLEEYLRGRISVQGSDGSSQLSQIGSDKAGVYPYLQTMQGSLSG